jgi:hypothetical protein
MEQEDKPSTDLEIRGKGTTGSDTLPKGGIASSRSSQANDIPMLVGSLNERLDLYAKRLAIGSVSIVFGAVIFLLVAGGRMASQVDLLQATSMSLAKRIVNMNSALETMSLFDQKFTLLDQGNAELVQEVTSLQATSEGNQSSVNEAIGELQSTLLKLNTSNNSVVNQSQKALMSAEEQAARLTSLAQRVEGLENGFRAVEKLNAQVSLLIQIEKENLKELFEAQLALEKAQLDNIEIVEPKDVVEQDTGLVVYPQPQG